MEFRRLFRGGVTVVDNEIRLIGRDAEISRDDVEFLFLRVLTSLLPDRPCVLMSYRMITLNIRA